MRSPWPDTSDCPFCKRVSEGDYERTDSPNVVAFEPLNPVTPGHRLFVPVEHVEDAGRAPGITGRAFWAAAVWAEQQGEDFNLITSSGAAATQTIKHLHVHYVPRTKDDDLHLPWTGQQPSHTHASVSESKRIQSSM